MALWQIDDSDLLMEILKEISVRYDANGIRMKGDKGGGPSTWNTPELQFVHTFANGNGARQVFNPVHRIFYRAALAYIEKHKFDLMDPAEEREKTFWQKSC